MKRDISYFRRGQVYFLRSSASPKGSIQGYSRPYVIVSNDMCNMHSPIIHIAPVTSQDKSNLPTHVSYDPENGKLCTILCEQTTVITKDELRKGQYQYSLSDDIMKQVDNALAVQFGINSPVSWEVLENLVEKFKEYKLSEMEEEINRRAEAKAESLISKLTEKRATEPPKPTKPVTPPQKREPMSQVDKFNKRYSTTPTLPEPSPTGTATATKEEPKKSTRISWTEDMKHQFMKDVKSMSKEDVCSKYGITPSNYSYRKCVYSKLESKESLNLPPKDYMTSLVKDYKSMGLTDFMNKYKFSSREEAIRTAKLYEQSL